MAVLLSKKIIVIFLVVFVATSNAAHRARFVTMSDAQEGRKYEEIPKKTSHDDYASVKRARERMLRMNNHDYGSYEPTPTLSKSKSKLIPN